jgi:hypothetical protein
VKRSTSIWRTDGPAIGFLPVGRAVAGKPGGGDANAAADISAGCRAFKADHPTGREARARRRCARPFTFSKNRHGRFRKSDLLRRVFETVLRRCIEEGLVGGEGFAVDASLIKADANRQKGIEGEKGLPPSGFLPAGELLHPFVQRVSQSLVASFLSFFQPYAQIFDARLVKKCGEPRHRGCVDWRR